MDLKTLAPALAFIVFGVLAIASERGDKRASSILTGVGVLAALAVGFLAMGAWGALQLGLTP